METLPPIKIKRVYEKPQREDGLRVLVDRLWPRGLKKETARIDMWLKELSPSDELRRWFAHDPKRWEEFKQRYHQELKNRDNFIRAIFPENRLEQMTFLYAARDEKHNNAMAFREYLLQRFH